MSPATRSPRFPDLSCFRHPSAARTWTLDTPLCPPLGGTGASACQSERSSDRAGCKPAAARIECATTAPPDLRTPTLGFKPLLMNRVGDRFHVAHPNGPLPEPRSPWKYTVHGRLHKGAAIFVAILIAIFLPLIRSGEQSRAAQERSRARRMAEHGMNARLLRLNIS